MVFDSRLDFCITFDSFRYKCKSYYWDIHLWILTYDIFMFVVHGSQPFSFLQTLCTIIIWKRRGNAVTTVPYKVVFAVYLNLLLKILYDAHFVDLESMKSSTNRILLLSGIVNSSMLAVTRF